MLICAELSRTYKDIAFRWIREKNSDLRDENHDLRCKIDRQEFEMETMRSEISQLKSRIGANEVQQTYV